MTWRDDVLTAPTRGAWRELDLDLDLRGDKPGHKFHGNQWGGTGRVEAKLSRDEVLAHPAMAGFVDGTRAPEEPVESGGIIYHDPALETIAHVQGFDGPPTVVKEFSDNTTGDVLYRGLPDQRFVEEFRTGDYFAGTGIMGSGTYTTNNGDYAANYKGAHGGTLQMRLKKDAKVLTRNEADDMQYAERAKVLKDPAKAKLFEDPGRVAAMNGYDAIHVKRTVAPGSSGDYTLVLNRTAVEVLG